MDTSSTRATSVFHVSTSKTRATEVVSKSRGKRFSINNSVSVGTDLLSQDMTLKSPTIAVEPVRVLTIGPTEGVKDFMHHTQDLLFVKNRVRSSLHVGSTDGSLGHERSLGSTSSGAGTSTGDIAACSLSTNEQNIISIDTRSQSRRSGRTTDTAGRGLKLSRDRVLDLESLLVEVKNRGNEVILNIVSEGARNTTQASVIGSHSHVAIAGKSSASMIITFRVEVFFDIKFDVFRKFVIVLTMGTFPVIVGETIGFGTEKS